MNEKTASSQKPALPLYFDYASATPLDPRVKETMVLLMDQTTFFGNSSAVTHQYGWLAQERVELARAQVAKALNAENLGVYFTSGATESINLALSGTLSSLLSGRLVIPSWDARKRATEIPHVITSAVEHKAVLKTLQCWAADERIRLTVIAPDAQGYISAEAVAQAFEANTVLVSIMHVNNELGVIYPVEEIAQCCQERHVLFHVDAAQSVGKAIVDVSAWGADLVSFSGHKAYGPKGVGALYCGPRTRGFLTPLLFGGSHEQGLRPSTVAVHQVAGMAEAFSIAVASQAQELQKYQHLRTVFLSRLQRLSDWVLHAGSTEAVPSILSLGFHGVDGEALLVALKSIAVSSGSACNSVTLDPSHVLLACGIERNLAASTLRFSFGRFTDEAQVIAAADHIVDVVNALRG